MTFYQLVIKGEIMSEQDFTTFINEARENFKIAIDDLFNAIEIIKDDVEKIKADKKTLE